MNPNLSSRIRRQLQAAFRPLELDIRDDSALHTGHAHAGEGHYHVHIVSMAFAAQPQLQRHRMVYAALADLLKTDVHALSIKALAPGESP